MWVAEGSRTLHSAEVMRVLWFLPFVLMGCAREVESPPQPEPVVKVAEREKPVVSPNLKKSGAGKVTFAGLSTEQLNRIRVIPEKGRILITPGNQLYAQVDGFWWKGEAGEWFKIPDYSEAWVGKNPPEEFVSLPEKEGLPVAVRNLGVPSWVRLAMGKVGEPGWYPDDGATRSPVSSPWRP